MSYFPQALAATLAHEGGYVNDPLDRGGETYRGISRKHHPDWPGWGRVDELKKTVARRQLDEDPVLGAMLGDFYLAEYWEPIGGDALNDQVLACAVFDCAVNLGVKKAVWFLQRALNALSKRGALSGYVVPDRVWGRATALALRSQLAAKGSAALVTAVEGMRVNHYINLIDHDPTLGRFAYGWMARAAQRNAA